MLDCRIRAYLLRNIPLPLWLKARDQAKSDGYSLRLVLIKLLHRYVRGELKP